MDKEQKKRMAWREFIGTDPEQKEISYRVQVSGGRVWLHREWEEEWDNADGTGCDTVHDCWTMSTDDLKSLIKAVEWCIEKSEAFEEAHPIEEIHPMTEAFRKASRSGRQEKEQGHE